MKGPVTEAELCRYIMQFDLRVTEAMLIDASTPAYDGEYGRSSCDRGDMEAAGTADERDAAGCSLIGQPDRPCGMSSWVEHVSMQEEMTQAASVPPAVAESARTLRYLQETLPDFERLEEAVNRCAQCHQNGDYTV